MSRILLGLILIGLLGGCQSKTAVSPPSPTPLVIEIAPALDWLRPEMADCASQTPTLSMTVQSASQQDQSLENADILLRWSESIAANGKTLKIGEDYLAVIIHPDNPLQQMDEIQLAAVYSGAISDWETLPGSLSGEIHRWVYPPNDDSQILFDSKVLAEDEIVLTAMIAPSPEGMLDAVREDPHAIGFIPARWLEPSVKPVPIYGYAKSDLTMPILAVTDGEPSGFIRDWLLCVQDTIQP